jgi:hypothetical protein
MTPTAQLRLLRLVNLLAALWLLLIVVPCQASSYRWTDKNGTLHFSDTPPAGYVPQRELDLSDPEQRPLIRKMPPIYRDHVFRLFLVSEQQDRLEFDLEYTAIHHSYTEIVEGRVMATISAVDSARTPTYLAYTVAPVEGGDGRVKLVNYLSKYSPSHLETDSLMLTLYRNDREKGVAKLIFNKEIPFRKSWEKIPGGRYQ